MINKIGALGNINLVSKPSFKASEKEDVVTNPQVELKTPEALANYGVATIKMNKKFDIKPIIPTIYNPNYTHAIKGERIYTSDDRLYSIVDENETTKTEYFPNKDDDRFFDKIITTNKETGNVIFKQDNFIEDGKYKEMTVSVFSKDTGEIEADSIYENGELYTATKYLKNEDGSREDITYYYKDKEYTWTKSSKDGKNETYTRMTKDLKFVNYSENKRMQGKETEVEARFYNGALISLSEEKRTIVPNLLGREPLNDEDLKPAEKYNLETILPDLEGEKTYFSNGAVESIVFPDGTAFFTPEGKLEKITSPTKEIEVTRNGGQIIKEIFDKNTTKTTRYYADDLDVDVKYENNDKVKELRLNSDLKPRYYSEENKKDETSLSLWYNKQGVLETAYNF